MRRGQIAPDQVQISRKRAPQAAAPEFGGGSGITQARDAALFARHLLHFSTALYTGFNRTLNCAEGLIDTLNHNETLEPVGIAIDFGGTVDGDAQG